MTKVIDALVVADDDSIQLRDSRGAVQLASQKECVHCYKPVGQVHDTRCPYRVKHRWSQLLPRCDFRSISRDPNKVQTRVALLLDRFNRTEYEWIVAGEGHLDRYDERNECHQLRVYLGRNATDFEHDSAYVLQLPIYNVRFREVWYGNVEVSGLIPPDLQLAQFNVPKSGYNPFELDGTVICDDQNFGPDHEPHPIVPQDHYVPKGDPEQLKLVRGKRVRIVFGPASEEKP